MWIDDQPGDATWHRLSELQPAIFLLLVELIAHGALAVGASLAESDDIFPWNFRCVSGRG
jgi:hypothetical protein